MDKSKTTTIVKGFLQYLKKENSLDLLPEIVRELENKIDEERLMATVISSVALTKSQEKDIEKIMFDKFATKNLQFKVDTDLIGGIRIQIGDEVLDLSFQNKLDHLAKSI